MVRARGAYFRASNYFRTAGLFLMGVPVDRRLRASAGKQIATFRQGAGTVEELYFANAVAALERGYNVFAFDGPGQGSVILAVLPPGGRRAAGDREFLCADGGSPRRPRGGRRR